MQKYVGEFLWCVYTSAQTQRSNGVSAHKVSKFSLPNLQDVCFAQFIGVDKTLLPCFITGSQSVNDLYKYQCLFYQWEHLVKLKYSQTRCTRTENHKLLFMNVHKQAQLIRKTGPSV